MENTLTLFTLALDTRGRAVCGGGCPTPTRLYRVGRATRRLYHHRGGVSIVAYVGRGSRTTSSTWARRARIVQRRRACGGGA
jgi:hypothetical protein